MTTKKELIKILLVEDDQLIADMYQARLTEEGFKVFWTAIGSEGLKIAATEQPDIVLLDVILPEMDGFTILNELKAKADTKNIPVVLLTNLGQDSDLTKGKQLGAQEYLVKASFTPTQIVEEIKKVLKIN
ncbi:MAG: response regulator [Candidatus Buchananbacteria bacterium]